jgi:hypothetical protein
MPLRLGNDASERFVTVHQEADSASITPRFHGHFPYAVFMFFIQMNLGIKIVARKTHSPKN